MHKLILAELGALALVLAGCSSPMPELPALNPSPIYVDEPAMREPYGNAIGRLNVATGLELQLTDDPTAPVRAWHYPCPNEGKAACGIPWPDHYAIYYNSATPREGLIMHEHIHQLAIATNAEHLPNGNVFAPSAGSCLTAADLLMICRARECTRMVPECP